MQIHLLSDNKKKQLIAIAAQNAGFDTADKSEDSDYRLNVLHRLTGHYSTSKMKPYQLDSVLKHFIDSGFKLTAAKSASKANNPAWLKKLISIWMSMHEFGFVHNPSFRALESWAMMTLKKESQYASLPNKLDWMGKYSQQLIESLKAYYARKLREAIPAKWDALINAFTVKKQHFDEDETRTIQLLWERVPVLNSIADDGLEGIYCDIQRLLNKHSDDAS